MKAETKAKLKILLEKELNRPALPHEIINAESDTILLNRLNIEMMEEHEEKLKQQGQKISQLDSDVKEIKK